MKTKKEIIERGSVPSKPFSFNDVVAIGEPIYLDSAEAIYKAGRQSLIEELKKDIEGLKDREHKEGSFKSDYILDEVLQLLNNK
jgi:hypothetical protein